MPTTPSSTKYILGRGSALAINTGTTTTPVWTPITGAKTASFSGGKSDMDDITNFGSTGAYREYAPTILDAGQVQVDGVFNATDPGQTALQAAFNAQAATEFQLTLVPMAGMTQAFVRTFLAYVSEPLNLDVQFDKSVSFKAALKITGPITDTVPTS